MLLSLVVVVVLLLVVPFLRDVQEDDNDEGSLLEPLPLSHSNQVTTAGT